MKILKIKDCLELKKFRPGAKTFLIEIPAGQILEAYYKQIITGKI